MDDEAPAKVLLVDDEPANIELLNGILEDTYDVIFATDGPSAIEAATTLSPDIILLDVKMSGMDGYGVCALLMEDERTRDIPVIFVTAMDDISDETKGLEIGAVDYIVKPVRAPIVRARVRNHVLLKRTRDKLAKLAAFDQLTGIPNRRTFEERFDAEWRRASRAETPLTLAMIDIDYFKPFNDTYGHPAGDECLRRVAKALADLAHRPGDMVARLGGEEFVFLLPGADGTGAARIADDVQKAIAALAIPHSGSKVADHVTLSMGVVTAIPTREFRPAQALKHADMLLYEAKGGGRNQARFADFPPKNLEALGAAGR